MATDKLVDFDHVTDYISREAAVALTDQHCFETSYDAVWMEEELKNLPQADVVARDCYDRVLAENDTMRKQLAQIGKKTGDKMDDVRPVVRGHYVGEYDGYADGNPVYDMWYCSECGCYFEDWDEKPTYNFCPNCGADMRKVQSNG